MNSMVHGDREHAYRLCALMNFTLLLSLSEGMYLARCGYRLDVLSTEGVRMRSTVEGASFRFRDDGAVVRKRSHKVHCVGGETTWKRMVVSSKPCRGFALPFRFELAGCIGTRRQVNGDRDVSITSGMSGYLLRRRACDAAD